MWTSSIRRVQGSIMRDRRLTFMVIVAFILFSCKLLYHSLNDKQVTTSVGEREDGYGFSMNATLGFGSIQHIKIENTTNHDLNQHVASLAAGLQRNIVDSTIQEDDSGQVLDILTRLRPHMVLWHEMVTQDIQTMLILETDAIWGQSIKAVHWRIAEALNRLLSTNPTEDDPYSSQSWDVISFGTCGDTEILPNTGIIFDDPDAPYEDRYFETPLNHQRVIGRAGYLACTTSYAISQRGATRMLVRSAMGMGNNLDYIIGKMSAAGELDVFSVYPPTFAIDRPKTEN
jgi:hypothetical protein